MVRCPTALKRLLVLMVIMVISFIRSSTIHTSSRVLDDVTGFGTVLGNFFSINLDRNDEMITYSWRIVVNGISQLGSLEGQITVVWKCWM